MRLALFGIIAVAASGAAGQTVWVGRDTQSPVWRYDTSGNFLGTWGATGATGSAIDPGGYVYTAVAGAQSVVTRYDVNQNPVGSFVFNGAGDPGGYGLPGWIEDMAWAGGGDLWIAGYNGMVSRVDSGGTILSQFYCGISFVGVATDGNVLYTSSGFYGNSNQIHVRDFNGNILNTITTGNFTGACGIGYDAVSNTLWQGYVDGTVREFALNGAFTGRTFNAGAPVDGLEVGDPIPAPGAAALLGLAAAGAVRRRR